jgi:hypothetical protein
MKNFIDYLITILLTTCIVSFVFVHYGTEYVRENKEQTQIYLENYFQSKLDSFSVISDTINLSEFEREMLSKKVNYYFYQSKQTKILNDSLLNLNQKLIEENNQLSLQYEEAKKTILKLITIREDTTL